MRSRRDEGYPVRGASGNRASPVDPDGGVSTYWYDGRNLLSSLVNPLAERTTWVYDELARLPTSVF